MKLGSFTSLDTGTKGVPMSSAMSPVSLHDRAVTRCATLRARAAANSPRMHRPWRERLHVRVFEHVEERHAGE